MKKSTFIKSVHKALRDAGISHGRMGDGVRYESSHGSDIMTINVISAFNCSMTVRYKHVGAVVEALESAGIVCSGATGILVDIRFADNGVED